LIPTMLVYGPAPLFPIVDRATLRAPIADSRSA
jgi:hypothetical protein